MWAGDGDWRPSILDIGRDDYFRHGRPGCPDLAESAFVNRCQPGQSRRLGGKDMADEVQDLATYGTLRHTVAAISPAPRLLGPVHAYQSSLMAWADAGPQQYSMHSVNLTAAAVEGAMQDRDHHCHR